MKRTLAALIGAVLTGAISTSAMGSAEDIQRFAVEAVEKTPNAVVPAGSPLHSFVPGFEPGPTGQARFQHADYQPGDYRPDRQAPRFIQVQAPSSDALMLLLDQFSAMRSELETLRGMVEEQEFQIRRLQRDSMDRYSDLDARISALYQDLESGQISSPGAGTGSTGNNAAPPAPTPPVQTDPLPNASGSVQSGAQDARAQVASPPQAQQQTGAVQQSVFQQQPATMMTEQQLYQMALDMLLQEEQYQQSISGFNQYLQMYPDGRFVTNAHYWMGQAYVNLAEFELARRSFETIVTDYPDGRKIEDAMYSLGTVYHRLGDTARGRELLQQVRTRFPNTSAANLADIYLRTLN